MNTNVNNTFAKIMFLTHFSSMFDFYTPWKRQKSFSFHTFLGVMEMENLFEPHAEALSNQSSWRHKQPPEVFFKKGVLKHSLENKSVGASIT